MRSKGVRVDLDKAEQTKTKLLTMKKQILKEIKDDTNIDVEPWVATSVAKVFDYHNIHYDETGVSKTSILYKKLGYKTVHIL